MSHLCLPLHSLAQSDPDRVVVSCQDRSATAAALVTAVAALSRALTEQLGVLQDDRVVLLGLNSDIFWTCLLAVLDAGAVACPLNWRWSPAELAAALRLLQPKVLFVDAHCMPMAQQACSSIAGSSSTSLPLWTLVRMCPTGVATSASAASSRQQGRQHSVAGEPFSTAQLLLQAQSPAAAAAAGLPTSRQQPPNSQQSQQPQAELQLLHPGPTQPALIVFTSGTTGASKGVMLSHNSLTHQSLAKLAVVQYSSSDVYLHMAPLFHVGGLSSAFAVLMAGGTHVFMPRYSPATALQLIRQHSVTSLIAVPAMMQDLTQAAAAVAAGGSSRGQHQHQQQQLPSLQRVLVGAGGMPLRLQQAVAALFPHASLHTAYGMTEASSSMTFISVAQQQQLMAAAAAAGVRQSGAAAVATAAAAGVCVGKPGPGIAVRIDTAAVVDSSSGSSSSSSSSSSATGPSQQQQQQQQGAEGVVGEVCTRGPHVMLGYWQDPLATSKTLSPDGWLHTGDLGFMDAAGNLWLVGRLKDMVKTGGENVHAAEVEGVLLSHPAVAAAAVFGLEHARLGEQVAAVVVLHPGWEWEQPGLMLPAQQDTTQQQQQQQQQGLVVQQQGHHGAVSAAVLQQHCRASLLSAYKLPRLLVCAQQLPCNSSGKVVKALLKQRVQQLLAAGPAAAGSSSGGRDQVGSRLLTGALRSKL